MQRCACGEFRLTASTACDACLRHRLYGRAIQTALDVRHLHFGLASDDFFCGLEAVADLMTAATRARLGARDERNEILREAARDSRRAFREGYDDAKTTYR